MEHHKPNPEVVHQLIIIRHFVITLTFVMYILCVFNISTHYLAFVSGVS